MREKEAKNNVGRWIVYSYPLVFLMIWLNRYLQAAFSTGRIKGHDFVTSACTALFMVLVLYWMYCIRKEPKHKSRRYAAMAVISAAVLLSAGWFETESFSLFKQEDLVLGIIRIPKTYFFTVWSVIVFPIFMEGLFASMKEGNYKAESVINGVFSIIILSLEGIFLFKALGNIYEIRLLVFNTVTLVLSLWKYGKTIGRRKKALIISAFVLLRGLCLGFMCSSPFYSFSSFMMGNQYNGMIKGIREIVFHASLIGPSEYLINSSLVTQWIYTWEHPILKLLFCVGWIPSILFILLLGFMIAVVIKLVSAQSGQKNKDWVMFSTAAALIIERIIMGTAFNFGFPYPVSLPFFGINENPMDYISMAFLLVCARENQSIQQYERAHEFFIQADLLLGNRSSYLILNRKRKPYSKSEQGDKAWIPVKGILSKYYTDWYELEEGTYCVFTEDIELDPKIFILEYAYGNWILPNGTEIQKRVTNQYMKDNKPDWMD